MKLNSPLRICTLALAAALIARGEVFHAKIATEDGSPLPSTPQIIPDMSQRLIQNCRIVNMFGDGMVEYVVDWRSRPFDLTTVDMCSVTIRMKGYQPTQATFRNNGVVTLKRIGDDESSLVSTTALKAPEPAQKAYGKGVALMIDEKWAAAQKNFEKAVEIYPDYAAAWSDMGETLKHQSKSKEARDAWERAVTADPKYLRPYLQLARLGLEEHRMEDAANIADRALAMNPVEFPAIYFYDAAANYNLKRFDVCEKAARRAVDLDTKHQIPRAEYLLGSVLVMKGDRSGALEHLKKYLQISPNAPDADNVNKMIARIEGAPAEAK